MEKVHVKKGDSVLVISGKEKGKRGKVLRVVPDKGRLMVEGVNMVKKHQKPTQKVMQGGIITQEALVPASNVMLVCPRCNQATRIRTQVLADGGRVRVCVRCGEVIDK